eukprot:XP_001706749.1 Hypothetical protein GL50803_37738 [Giardia lamblia ATCC 50803]
MLKDDEAKILLWKSKFKEAVKFILIQIYLGRGLEVSNRLR